MHAASILIETKVEAEIWNCFLCLSSALQSRYWESFLFRQTHLKTLSASFVWQKPVELLIVDVKGIDNPASSLTILSAQNFSCADFLEGEKNNEIKIYDYMHGGIASISLLDEIISANIGSEEFLNGKVY